jgi:hypothetical protein
MKCQSVTFDFQNGGGQGPPLHKEKGRTGENLGRPEQSQGTRLISQSQDPGNGVKQRRRRTAQPSDGASQVYFIQSEQTRAIKIDVSTNPKKRLASLQTANGGKLIRPPHGPCCLAWIEQRPAGLYRLRRNCRAFANHGRLYLRRAA